MFNSNKKIIKLNFKNLIFFMLFFFSLPLITYFSLPEINLDRYKNLSPTVSARDGELLNVFLSKDHAYRFETQIENIDPRYIESLLILEDKWFWIHFGINPFSLFRASSQWISSGKIVSGGSTITMQLARLLEPKQRTLWNKWVEIVRAIELEIRFSKKEILKMYLTMLPMGGNLEGVRAACMKYWGKEPRNLSLSEVALLLAIPQSPEARRPDKKPQNTLIAVKNIGKKLIDNGLFPVSDMSELRYLPFEKLKPFPNIAWHFSNEIIKKENDMKQSRPIIVSSIDYRIQQIVNQKAKLFSKYLSDDQNVAILVTNAKTGEILAHLGSLSFNSTAGFMDLTRAIRSPGSTLKPFIYGMAFDDNLITSQTILYDTPKTYDGYTPSNFDKGYQGPVRAGEALQKSLNIPAVSIISELGVDVFYQSWQEAGLVLKLPKNSNLNVGIALGAVGTRLHDLVQAYSSLANEGNIVPLIYEKLGPNVKTPRQLDKLLTRNSAEEILEILASSKNIEGRASRAIKSSFKTGTSYGYRDSWAIGIKGSYVIGVWAGRPDGTPVPGQTGRNVSLRLANDIADKLYSKKVIKPWSPESISIAKIKKPPIQLIYPTDGTKIILSEPPSINRKFKINLSGGNERAKITINEKILEAKDKLQLKIPIPYDGTYEIKIFDSGLLVETVLFTVFSQSL